MISVVVLTRDKKDAKDTLRSVDWCDEVIILENANLDNYAAQRNIGLEKAKGDWILFVDDDEIVSDKLRDEILNTIEITKIDGYYLKRLDFFGGRFLKYGETGNIKLLRLGKRGAGKWSRKVHEVWNISKTSTLENPLYHYPHPSIKQFITSINKYTDLDVVELKNENKNFNVCRLVLNPVGKFLQNYFVKLGFLDGFAGFTMAFMMSLHSLTVRVKQYETK